VITNGTTCTRKIKSQSFLAKAALNKMKKLHSKMNFNLRKKPVKLHIWSITVLKLGHFGK